VCDPDPTSARTVQTTFAMRILSLEPSENASELNENLDVIKRWEILNWTLINQESPISIRRDVRGRRCSSSKPGDTGTSQRPLHSVLEQEPGLHVEQREAVESR
jgi:hypothetical protein